MPSSDLFALSISFTAHSMSALSFSLNFRLPPTASFSALNFILRNLGVAPPLDNATPAAGGSTEFRASSLMHSRSASSWLSTSAPSNPTSFSTLAGSAGESNDCPPLFEDDPPASESESDEGSDESGLDAG